MRKFEEIWPQLGAELESKIKQKGGLSKFAELTDTKYDTLRTWLKDQNPARLVNIMDVISHLGLADMNDVMTRIIFGRSEVNETVMIPVYDVQLAAGDGALNERADLIDKMPFSFEDLQRITPHADPARLAIFEARGDSMEPYVQDRDRIMVDLSDQRFRDGIFAFDLHNEARVKRFKFGFTEVVISSENADAGEPMVLKEGETDQLNLIGRIVWRSGLIRD